MRKALPLFTLLILLFSTFGETHQVYGEGSTLNEIQKDRKQVEKNLSKKEKEIVDVLDEIEVLHKEVTAIEKEIEKKNDHITKTEKEVLAFEDEFHQLLEDTKALNKQIESRTDILNNQLSAYQDSGGDITYLEVLFNAKSFLDFISRISSVTTITSAEKEIIEQQIDDKEAIEEIQDEIVEKIDEQEQLIEELEETKSVMDEKQASLKKSEKKLKKKEKNLKTEKEKLSKENNELKQVEKDYRKRMEEREKERKRQAEKEKQQQKEEKKKASKETNKNSSQPKSSSNNKSNSSSSNNLEVGKTLRVEATAYTPNCNGCSGKTATGLNVSGSNHQAVIAVDPEVIPLGSKVWVEGYGEAIAADTGGAIKGNRIDVLYKSKSAARQWGRRTVTVKVLK